MKCYYQLIHQKPIDNEELVRTMSLAKSALIFLSAIVHTREIFTMFKTRNFWWLYSASTEFLQKTLIINNTN